MAPVIDIDPLLIEDALLIFGANDHSAAVSSAVFTPTTSVQRWRGLSKTSEKNRVSTSWALDITKAQDWETAQSLSLYLWAHRGEDVPVEVHPRADSGPSFEATVTIPAFSIGGAAEQIATSTLSMPSTEPELVPAA